MGKVTGQKLWEEPPTVLFAAAAECELVAAAAGGSRWWAIAIQLATTHEILCLPESCTAKEKGLWQNTGGTGHPTSHKNGWWYHFHAPRTLRAAPSMQYTREIFFENVKKLQKRDSC